MVATRSLNCLGYSFCVGSVVQMVPIDGHTYTDLRTTGQQDGVVVVPDVDDGVLQQVNRMALSLFLMLIWCSRVEICLNEGAHACQIFVLFNC